MTDNIKRDKLVTDILNQENSFYLHDQNVERIVKKVIRTFSDGILEHVEECDIGEAVTKDDIIRIRNEWLQ